MSNRKSILFTTMAAGTILAGLASGQALATQPAGPRLVLVDVVVVDNKGPVRGLTKDNFLLDDKGKRQNIALFDITEAGKLKIPATPLPEGVYANKLNSKGEVQGTATVLLYDRINTDPGAQAFIRAQVLRVLGALNDTDRLGFYGLGFNLSVVHDYDEDAAPLAKAARALLQSGTVPDNFTPEEQATFKALSEALSPMQGLSTQARVNITYPAFRSVGHHLAGVLGRKNVMWVSSAFPLTYGNQQERRKNDEAEIQLFKNILLDANITLFPIDPAGSGGSFNQPAGAPVANEGSLMPGTMRNSAGTSAANISDSSLTGTQTFQNLANVTGGKIERNVNDISPSLKEVLSAAEYTYTLGFYPDEKNLDSKNHDLKVSLTKTDAKAKLTFKKQYFAWGPATPADQRPQVSLDDLLKDPLTATAIGLIGVTNPDPEKPGTQIVDVRIATTDIRFDPVGELFTPSFEVAVVSANGKGGVKSYTPTITAEQLQQVLMGGLDIGETIEVGPGSGQFRVAILDKKTGNTGSLTLPYRDAAQAK